MLHPDPLRRFLARVLPWFDAEREAGIEAKAAHQIEQASRAVVASDRVLGRTHVLRAGFDRADDRLARS